MKDDAQGNPKAVNDAVLGSDSDDFFASLEDSVNSLASEGDSPVETKAATPAEQGPAPSNTQAQSGTLDSELNNLKKRYSDSSREAQNLRAQLNELKPFVPVLNAMKKDGGLVNHVREYFNNGGEVNQDIKAQLKLDEDFVFDNDEMMNNADSDSRKVFNAMVDKVVQQRISETTKAQQEEANHRAWSQNLDRQAQVFMQKNSLTPEEFQSFVTEAQHKFQTEGMSFDDMWLIVNKNRAQENVAASTKKDMLNQMKSVRNIPTSQSATNNAGVATSQNDNVFDALLNSDGNIEDLLG